MVLRRIFVTFVCLVSFVAAAIAEAALPLTVNKVSHAVNKENVLRIVLDCSDNARGSLDAEDGLLTVTVNAALKAPIIKGKLIPGSENIKSYSINRDGNSTVLKVFLKKNLSKKDYKLFNLKKDPVTKRPARVVLDVTNGRKGAVKSTTTEILRRPARYRLAGGIAGKRICIDPGHGGVDPGAIGRLTNVYEKNITLPVSLKLRSLLQKKGMVVSMTRTTDKDVHSPGSTDKQELQARVDVAENNNADMFISVHCNASENHAMGGFTTYYHEKTGGYDLKLAKYVQERLRTSAKLPNLGVRSANFYVNKRSSMPGVLVELLFLSNAQEEKLLKSSWFQAKMAAAIAKGIEDFYANVSTFKGPGDLQPVTQKKGR